MTPKVGTDRFIALKWLHLPALQLKGGIAGSWGVNPNHAQAQIMNRFFNDLWVPPAMTIPIPYLDPKSDKTIAIWGETAIYLPSIWLRSIFEKPELEAQLETCFGIHKLKEFWDQIDLKKDPKVTAALTKTRGWKNKTIPLLLHGDGAAYQDRDSLMTASCSGLLKEGTVDECNLFLAAYPKTCTSKGENGTWHAISAWIAWDLNALLENKYQMTDPKGNPWPQGGQQILPNDYRCVLWSLQGDDDFFQTDIGLPNKSQVEPKPCCHLCRCKNK